MASENPGAFVNVPDSQLKDGRAIYDMIMQNAIKSSRFLYEMLAAGSAYAGETRQQYPHTHGDLIGDARDGEWIGRTIYGQTFGAGTTDGATWTIGSATWTELLPGRPRCWVGGVRRLACEVRYEVSANGVKFRLERWDWNDSSDGSDDAGGNGTQYLEETDYQTATSATNHTLDGDSYTSDGAGGYTQNGASATKLLYIDLGTYAAGDEDRALAEFRLLARGSGSCDLTIYSIEIHEVRTTEESGGGVLS